VFKERPSRRAFSAPWGPLKVLDIFQQWPVELPLFKLMRKGAFLLALATAKRASELVALLCVDVHFCWEGKILRFIPSNLTKTDRPGRLTPPFRVEPWKDDLCVCPVESVRLILKERVCLRLQHSALFFQWAFPLLPSAAAALVAALNVAS
jgi:hypothetical protein